MSVFNISDSSATTSDSSATTSVSFAQVSVSSAQVSVSSAQVSVSGFEVVESTATSADSEAEKHERARWSGGPVVRRGGSRVDGLGSSAHYAAFCCSTGVVAAVATAVAGCATGTATGAAGVSGVFDVSCVSTIRSQVVQDRSVAPHLRTAR